MFVHLYSSDRLPTHSPEPSLIAYIYYGYRRWRRPKFRHQSLLDTSTWAFKERICAHAISTKISFASTYEQ